MTMPLGPRVGAGAPPSSAVGNPISPQGRSARRLLVSTRHRQRAPVVDIPRRRRKSVTDSSARRARRLASAGRPAVYRCVRLEATNPPDHAVVDEAHQVRMAKSVERGAPVRPALLVLRNIGDVQADRRARRDVDTRTCMRREKTIRDEGHVFARRSVEPARRQPGAPCALYERQCAKATRGAAKTSYRIPVRWCDFSQPANRTGRRWW